MEFMKYMLHREGYPTDVQSTETEEVDDKKAPVSFLNYFLRKRKYDAVPGTP